MTIAGISHVSLTVTDLGRARAFWVDVMGFAPKVEQQDLLIVVDPNASVVISCVTHDDGDSDAFDERRVGLDHLALDVDGIDALHTWETTLDASNVVRSPIVESPFGWHLNVRAPDNIAVELLAMKPQASVALYG
jgi:catechol 2,3-dioxygenase-like lactoylglutathione lyase family enzyme